ncbi:MAG: hypothetical protein KatS3mg091_651 [Patescibacteria group bacterium]|nr:MAG: hypothetical protein KatS3mg091_651 [Patescibacteria group bacterium]
MKKIYLNVANLTIKIEFTKTEFPVYRNYVYKVLYDFFNNFLLSKTDKKISWTIKFINPKEKIKILSTDTNEFFINLYTIKNKTSFIPYSTAGIPIVTAINHTLFYLVKENGLLAIHSSSVLINDKVFIFIGPENAGKTTVKNFLKDKFKPIMDDCIIINKDENNKILAFQTPFLDKDPNILKQPLGYKIHSFYFLKKSNNFKIKKIKNKILISNLLLENFHVKPKNLSLLANIINNYTFYSLEFKNNKKNFLSNFFYQTQ